jgi:hypothetical protein
MDYTLKLGEWTRVSRGWLKRRRVMFAGEVSPGVYSLVAEWTDAHNSAAYNLFFHKNQKEFHLFEGHITIVSVTMDEIRFRFRK